MASRSADLGKTLMWGGITAALYGALFIYADDFTRLARTTLDACMVQQAGQAVYFNKASAELCAARGGSFIGGTWWFVFAPILMAFAVSYAHGIFTSRFWDVAGLKAKH